MVPSLLETSAETLAQNINNYEALEKIPEELVLYIFEVRALHSKLAAAAAARSPNPSYVISRFLVSALTS